MDKTEGSKYISDIEACIKPAVEKAKSQQGDLLTNSTINNVTNVINNLVSSSTVLSEKIKEGKLKVVGAYYNLDTGKVDFIK